MPLEVDDFHLEADTPRSGDEIFMKVWGRAEKVFQFLL
jgi:hypothetical protein